MEMPEKNYYDLINNLFSGYAYHKIITDSEGNPIDYEYIEINAIYCELIGVKGKMLLEKEYQRLFLKLHMNHLIG